MPSKWAFAIPEDVNSNPKEKINHFRGNFGCFSNMYSCSVEIEGIVYPSAEHAFVAGKTTDENLRREIATLDAPQKAKAFGKQLLLRPDWEEIQVGWMKTVLLAKFSQNQFFKKRLIDTGTAELIEGNGWHDNFWGSCFCSRPACGSSGKNTLGKLLMEVRETLR